MNNNITYDEAQIRRDVDTAKVVELLKKWRNERITKGESMTPELQIALDNLSHILKKENGSDGICVAVRIFFNSEGYEITYEHRTAVSLRKDYISMQNICGEFIK